MSISLRLAETVQSVTSKVNAAIAQVFNKTLSKNKNKVNLNIRMFVERQILAQPEIKELLQNNGPRSLTAMLGISNAEALVAVNAVVKAIVNSIRVNVDKIDGKLNGGLQITLDGIDGDDIPEGVKKVAYSNLNWMQWLLEKGDAPIIIGYRYSASDKGRTGGGIMKPGGVFRIPPAFSGTEENNFVTRALSGPEQQAEIEQIMRKALDV